MDLAPSPRQRTPDNSPATHRWEESHSVLKSEKRTTEMLRHFSKHLSAVRFPDYESFTFDLPAVNCWAIVSRPLHGLRLTCKALFS